MNSPEAKTTKVTSNVANLDVKNPIPFEPSGESSVFHLGRRNRGYLPFLDSKDNFFQLLLEAKKLSPTNSACVGSKTNFCIGQGLFIKDGSTNTLFDDFAKRVNKKGQSFDKLVKSAFNNHFTVGNNFIELIRGKVGNTKFFWVVNRSYLDCRLSDPNDDDICETVFISKEFRRKSAWTLDENKAVELPIYYGDSDGFEWYKSEGGTEHCIIHVKNEEPGYDYYGMPSNMASLPQQTLEYKFSRFNIDIVDNNMIPGGVVTIDGEVTPEEGKKIAKDIVTSYTGDGKRGRVAVVSGGKGIKTTFEQYDTQHDGSYMELDESVESKIIDANNWDKALYGQQAKNTGLGNGGFAYLSAIFETKNNTVIKPAQKEMMRDFISPFFKLYDEWMGTKFSDLELTFGTVSPASFVGEIDVNSCLTKNEGRAILGLPELTEKAKGEEFIKTEKSKKDVSA